MAVVADGIAECQAHWPTVPIVPIVLCGTKGLAEGWTYRHLAAARAWARAQGLEASDRGRIAAPIRQAWERATAPME